MRLSSIAFGFCAFWLCVHSAVAQPLPKLSKIDDHGRILSQRWRLPVVRTGFDRKVVRSFGRPAISKRHGVVIVGQGEGTVLAVRQADAVVLWRYEHKVPFACAVTLADVGVTEVALVVARDGSVLALGVEDGKLRWRSELGADSRAPALILDTLVLFATQDNKLHALRLQDGVEQWVTGRPPAQGLTVDGHAGIAHQRDVIFGAFSDGYVGAYDAKDGSKIWERPLSLSGGGFQDADADPMVVDGKVYVASYSDGVYALDVTDGRTLWQREGRAVVSLGLYDAGDISVLIVGSADGHVWGLHRSDGTQVYTTQLPTGVMSRLSVYGTQVAFTAGAAGLVILSAANGRPLQTLPLASQAYGDVAVGGKGNLALLSIDGYLYNFRQLASTAAR